MKKEEIGILAQLLSGMKDAIFRLEEAKRKKDTVIFQSAKKEILQLQWEMKKIL